MSNITTNSNITIVEYAPKYAAGVADMWNRSRQNWGGGNEFDTAEGVQNRESADPYLHLFLALDGEIVVGYAKMGKTKEESELEFKLLNLDPNYHGSGVGKQLVLKVLNTAIDYKCNNLDLFTWPGNTKAMPLYKRCGYFWVEDLNRTYCMNFMPLLLNMPLFARYLKRENWYQNANRAIEMSYDGVKEDGFEYLNYSWNIEGKPLLATIEKSGRGLCALDCADFSIKATISQHDRPFGAEYEISYHFVNKTATPLEIFLEVKDNKNICFDFKKGFVLTDKETISAKFRVDKIDKEQEDTKIHPVVKAKISINGLEGEFALGVKPVWPLAVMPSKESLFSFGQDEELYLNVENKLSTKTIFNLYMADNDSLKVQNGRQSVELAAGEKRALVFNCNLLKACYYNTPLQVEAVNELGSFNFEAIMSVIFAAYNQRFNGIGKNTDFLYDGTTEIAFTKTRQQPVIHFKENITGAVAVLMGIKFGKPFSDEFNSSKHENCSFEVDEDGQIMRLNYTFNALGNGQISLCSRVERGGFMSFWLEVENLPIDNREFVMAFGIYCEGHEYIFPYKEQIVKSNPTCEEENCMIGLDVTNLTERWLYTKDIKNEVGVSWSDDYKLTNINGYCLDFEVNFTELFNSGKKRTKPIFIGLNFFKNYQRLRDFSLGKKQAEHPNPVSVFDLQSTGFFVLEGDAKVNLLREKSEQPKVNYQKESKIDYQILEADINNISRQMSLKRVVYLRDNGKVDIANKGNIWEVDNGKINFKVDTDFAPVVYSLKYMGKEWLDTTYPTPGPRGWENPWVGGISIKSNAVNWHLTLREERTTNSALVRDNLGNLWQGLLVEYEFKKDKVNQGLRLKQYYLTLPGLAALVAFGVADATNFQAAIKVDIETAFALKAEQIVDSYIYTDESLVENLKLIAGTEDIGVRVDKGLCVYGSKNREELVHLLFANKCNDVFACPGKEVIRFLGYQEKFVKPQSKTIYQPNFMLFGKDKFQREWLKELDDIRFEV